MANNYVPPGRDTIARGTERKLKLRLRDERLAHKLARLADCTKAVDPFPRITVKLKHTSALPTRKHFAGRK